MAISTNTHVLNNIKIPRYDLNNSILVKLSQIGPHVLSSQKVEKAKFETRIDQLAAQLWGITAPELKDIQWNLADLQAGGRQPKHAALFD